MKKLNLTNVLLVITIIMAIVFINVTYGTYRKFSYEQKKMHVFYITNAGINQAIWYLSTPTSLGGYGPYWRTKSMKKFFSVGSYTISVKDSNLPGEILITSIGKAEGITLMLQATVVYGRSIPSVFDYALYSGGELEIGGASSISGKIFINDNLKLSRSVVLQNGTALITPGYNVMWEGKPEYKSMRPQRPYPVLPVLDTTFYYDKIAFAKSGDKRILQGDFDFKNVDLEGQTIYVNGNVTIKGNITGHGAIVGSRNMKITNNGRIDNGVYFICNGKLTVSGKHFVNGNSYFYSKQSLMLEDGTRLTGGAVLLSPTIIEVGRDCSISGLVYAPSIAVGGNAKINGSIAAENYALVLKEGKKPGAIENVIIKHDIDRLPLTVLGFNVGSRMIMKKPGSLKEI